MELTDLHKQIIVECADDDIGLWSILWSINGGGYSTRHPLAKGVREKAIEIIHDLLESGLIEPGFPRLPDHAEQELRSLQQKKPIPTDAIFELLNNNPPKWEPRVFSAGATINYIQREWDSLGQDPNIGDIIWFRATPAGERLAQTLKEQ